MKKLLWGGKILGTPSVFTQNEKAKKHYALLSPKYKKKAAVLYCSFYHLLLPYKNVKLTVYDFCIAILFMILFWESNTSLNRLS